MSEQPERVKGFVNVYSFGVGPFYPDRDYAESARGSAGRTAPVVELRPGETIVGPLEMAVIEAAINHQKIADAFKAEDDEDILCALAKKSTAAQRTLEAAVRALREARR